MASAARAMRERRRASRVPIRIPVKVFCSETINHPHGAPAEAVSVSRYGALLRASFMPPLGSRIEVLHGLSNELREFRVISARLPEEDGSYELGVEIYHPARNFWGIRFPGDPA